MTGYELYERGRTSDSCPWDKLPDDAKKNWERNAIEYARKVVQQRYQPR